VHEQGATQAEHLPVDALFRVADQIDICSREKIQGERIGVVAFENNPLDPDVEESLRARQTREILSVQRPGDHRDPMVGCLNDTVHFGVNAQTCVVAGARRCISRTARTSPVTTIAHPPRSVVVPGCEDHAVFDNHRADFAADARRAR